MTIDEMLEDLPQNCDAGSKKNSKGYTKTRKSGKFTGMLRTVLLTGFLICHRMLHLLTGSIGLKVSSGH